MVVGGQIESISWSNDELGSGVWFPKPSEAFTFDAGGVRVDDDDDGLDTGGRLVAMKKKVRWSFEGVVTWDMVFSDEAEQARKIAESNIETDFVISHIGGAVHKGRGTVVGDIKPSSEATMAVKIAGGGVMRKI